jgi:hypothetical protein
MKRNVYTTLILLVFTALLLTCTGQSTTILKGERLFGIEVSMTSSEEADQENGFHTAFNRARAMGIDFDHKAVNWTSIEDCTPDELVDPNSHLEIINYFYPLKQTAVYFTLLGPLNTTVRDVPNDLSTDDLDSTEMVSRAKNMVDFVLTEMQDTDLTLFVLGNEVDIYLENHPDEFDNFVSFFNQVKAHIKASKPDLPVATTVTLYGLTEGSLKDDLLMFVNASCDVLSITYYPLGPGYQMNDPSIVHDDFSAACALTNLPVYFQECGYPSSIVNNSSEEKQAVFMREMLRAWDDHVDQIKAVSIYLQTDWESSGVDDYVAYLDLTGDQLPLKEYIRTLGLRQYDGAEADKAAWSVLENGLKARGW